MVDWRPQGCVAPTAQLDGEGEQMRRNVSSTGEPETSGAAIRAYTFPRTPHIHGSSVEEDDDRTMKREELDALCQACEVVLQEKVDGTNVGIFFRSAGQPVLQKRAGLLAGREKEQYNVFRNWVWRRAEDLWSVLGTRWVLFGEWLWQTHAVDYNALPSFLIAFDLFDRVAERFAASAVVRDTAGDVLATVPELWRGHVVSADALSSAVASHMVRSAFADSPPEGVYIRFERPGELVARAKYRRPGFEPGWRGKPRLNRLVASEDVV